MDQYTFFFTKHLQLKIKNFTLTNFSSQKHHEEGQEIMKN